MNWTRRRSVTVVVAAFALGITITSLASGVSLRKMVKKEVSKQLGRAVGPAGPQGAPGPQGIPGTGYADFEGFGDPPASAEGQFMINDVDLPTGGKLLTMSNGSLRVICTAGGAVTLGLYVDGNPVPETLITGAVSNTAFPVDTTGVSNAVSSGAHQVSVGATCENGEPTGAVELGRPVGVVLLGP
jgi:hypothetical protein